MDQAERLTVLVEQMSAFAFRVRFDDEGPAAQGQAAPMQTSARLLAAAIGDCLSENLALRLRHWGVLVSGLDSELRIHLVRSERGRLRIGRVDVSIVPRDPLSEDALTAILAAFEDFRNTTREIREGIEVTLHLAHAPRAAISYRERASGPPIPPIPGHA